MRKIIILTIVCMFVVSGMAVKYVTIVPIEKYTLASTDSIDVSYNNAVAGGGQGAVSINTGDSTAIFAVGEETAFFFLSADGYYADSFSVTIADTSNADTLTLRYPIEQFSARLSVVATIKTPQDTIYYPSEDDSLKVTVVNASDDTLFSDLYLDSLGSVGLDPDSLTDGAKYTIYLDNESADTVYESMSREFFYDKDLGTQIIPMEVDSSYEGTLNTIWILTKNFQGKGVSGVRADVVYETPRVNTSDNVIFVDGRFTATSDDNGVIEFKVPDNSILSVRIDRASWDSGRFYSTDDDTLDIIPVN